MKSLVKHFSHIPTRNIDQVMQVIARFTVGLIDTHEMNQELAQFELEVRCAVRLWRHWALSSFYWGNLWRAIIAGDPERWKVHPEDTDLIKSYLRREDHAKIDDLYFFRSVGRLSHDVVMEIQQKLRKFAWSMYHKYLRFVAKYDKGLSSEDLVASIMEAGLRALRRYEHQDNPLKTLNYAKRAAKNEAINIIGRNTRIKRARIVAASASNPDRQYLCRTVSLEEVQPLLENQHASDPLYDYIRVQLGPEYERYARAILGEWPDFDAWVATTHEVAPEKLPRRKLERFAREWSGITTEQARRNLGPLLVEKLRVEETYFAFSQPT